MARPQKKIEVQTDPVLCQNADSHGIPKRRPTALGPVANTDTKLLIYGLFQKSRVLAQDGDEFSRPVTISSELIEASSDRANYRDRYISTFCLVARKRK